MPLTILSVAYPLAPVGSDAVGGAEQILTQIDAALVRAGHTSLVVAQENSSTSGQLLPVPRPDGILGAQAQAAAQAATGRAIRHALTQYPIDLIHVHGLDFDRYLPPLGPPLLATLHLPPHLYSGSVWSISRPATYLHAVSRSQHALLPRAVPEILAPITNGVPLNALRPSARKQDFLLAIGRICPEKGFDQAAEAARRIGMPLVLAGRVFAYAEHERYFLEVLQPLIERGPVSYVGPVGMQRKASLLGQARCVLIASRIAETSSLVAMEALACGTPVIAFRAGALEEVIDHGRTGFVVDNVEGMTDALRQLDSIDPAHCRVVAETRFSADRMAADYLDRYERIVSRVQSRRPVDSSHSDGLSITTATSVGAMEEVCQEWANLWHRSTARSVFQHPDWLIPWCRPFGVREPWVLLARRGRRLVGVAPFVIYERGSERVLTLLGAGVSDDQGVIIEPGDEQRVMNSIWEYLARHAERFDVCELENLTRESRLLGVPTPAGWQAGSPRRHDVRPVLHLPPATGGLDGLLPRGMLKRVRYAAHQAERTGHPPRFEHVSAANFDELFGALTRLHRARWAARSQPGMLTPDLEEFHHEAARRLLARGMLRMHALSLGNHVVAVFYGYHAGTRTVYYLSGFDPEYDTFSPGNLVVAAAIEYSVTHDDARAFDFLRGAEAYKYAWGAADEPLFAIQLRYVGTEEAAHAA